MKYMAFILVALGFSISHAQVLGELKGAGPMTASYERLDGSYEYMDLKCTVALNYHQSAEKVDLDFSFYDCNRLGGWNDLPVSLKVQGGSLVDAQGQEKGRILADGTVEFTAHTYSTVQYQDTKYDFNCQPYSTSKKTLRLDKVTSYTFAKVEEGYRFTRKQSEDRMAYKSRKGHARCPAVIIPAKMKSSSSLMATIK
ncbi:hypothetical protein EZJ49_04000 [Bdellovibrio bacteriovorus]|uniref:hypothetical protein n=1 Tax=Bdellovibrio bacteriovorus TaxID=959 RepID=UPI0021D0BF2D|nr:hypothetical protein [Bdellovibrio bacteriovorus]UXR65414.1 hypothetical protein EZJ49_04000 [Bdellovibrio bacteriovorus]